MSDWFPFDSSSASQTPLRCLLKMQILQRIHLSEAQLIAILVRVTLRILVQATLLGQANPKANRGGRSEQKFISSPL